MMYQILLVIHVLAGVVALVSAFVAIVEKGLNSNHRWHIISGIAFTLAMTIIFVTVVPLTIIRPSLFLLLVGIFSFYLAVSGWRYAKNRAGKPQFFDWALSGIMLAVSLGMLVLAGLQFLRGNANGVIVLVFGLIGSALSYFDLRLFRRGGVTGKARIAQHLTMMLAGTIAAITAFAVNVGRFEPAIVLWLAPTVVITPIINYWRKRYKSGVPLKVAGVD